MIPVKLSVRNFMCYRDKVPPIYFTDIHTGCICGNNGNGKSALIDALTWALWGKTRAKSDDDIIHQGETEVAVEFDFAIGQQVYRIIRMHSKPGRQRASGRTILEFQVASGDSFKPISGTGVLETQKKIIDVLHMDYETFQNSAFLRQGHADEFTLKRPAERKEVLANILGLSIYDELEEQAKSRAKLEETKRAQLELAIQDLTNELAQKPAFEAQLNQVQGELERQETLVAEFESGLSRQRQQREALENKKTQLFQLESHISETKKDLDRWQEQARQHRSRVKNYEELITQRPAIELGYNQFMAAQKLNDELDRKLRQLSIINERKHQLEMSIERVQAALLSDHRLVQHAIEELEAKCRRLPQLKDELRQVQDEQNQLSAAEETLRQKRQDYQEAQAQVSHLQSDKARLEQESAGIEDKLRLLTTQQEAKCPLCETELGPEGIKLIEAKYATERDLKSDSLKAAQVELASKKASLSSLFGELSLLEQRLNQNRASVQSRASLLSRELAEAEAAGSQVEQERGRLAEIELRLARKSFAPGEQQALGELETELAKIGYSSQQHEEVRQRLDNLKQHENAKLRLDEAGRSIEQEREAASRAEEAVEMQHHRLEVENQKRQELTVELTALPQLLSDLANLESEFQSLSNQLKRTREISWGLKVRLERCSELEVKRREREKLLNQALTEEKVYKDLAQAFGKNGIQAMLIETALPEIEVEANKLLARMTDNRMQVKIETQRETKKGDLLETLDINISDELGTRSYEMFSGGEAFRINFAIRIALSKLLAHRAGAPLRTLIIDEGFGTQDSSGIEKIKEAINSIQDDFDKILVITHIDELRDAFPARIDVIKTADGSTIEMS